MILTPSADTNDTSDTDTTPPPPTYDCGDDTVYEPVPIGDWKVCRAISLHENQPIVSSVYEIKLYTFRNILNKPLKNQLVKGTFKGVR